MKRIIVICEGPTEREFCEKTLYPYFFNKKIIIESPLIKKSHGGIVKWLELKKQVENHLKQDKTVYVTMLIDYYGLHQKFNFPSWDESFKIVDKNSRLDFLEEKMQDDINQTAKQRFIPYFQLHEFEGLLFNDINIFYEQFEDKELIGKKQLEDTFKNYLNPELINDKKETAPSYRLKRIIKGYKKVVYGNIIAEVIGLSNIRKKSPRFNEWINKIESI